MKSLLELYGQQFRNTMPDADSQDYTTSDVFGQMAQNKRRAEYDNSLLGMVHNWATGEQRQPVQLPDDASWLDQAKEAGARFLNLPNDMAAGGAKTIAHWLGAAGNPEMVEPQDMLAPLGIGAMAGLGGAVPRGAVGSAGGKPNAGRAAVTQGTPDVPAYQADYLSPSQQPSAQMAGGQQARMPDVGGQPALAGRNKLRDELFADQSRSSLPGLLAGAVDEPKVITAYHGSPHDFDRFSMDKIGTGEGAQAYGHGLYFAENEGVANAYKKQLTDRTNFVRPDGSLWSADELEHMNVRATAYRGDIDGAIAKARDLAGDDSPVAGHAQRDLEKLLALQASGGVKPNPGRMYEVRINANPDDFLDWDKPLSQQSEKAQPIVRDMAKNKENLDGYINDPVGEYLYGFEDKAPLTAKLREAGIPGIRYLDQGSRTAGDGSRNYVVFDDALVEILRKYGLLGMIGGGSLLGSSESEASPAGGLFGVP